VNFFPNCEISTNLVALHMINSAKLLFDPQKLWGREKIISRQKNPTSEINQADVRVTGLDNVS
jgi:hypothetical protein